MSAAGEFRNEVQECIEHIRSQLQSRCYRAANEMRNASVDVLTRKRAGRVYKVPGTFRKRHSKSAGGAITGVRYVGSAPGEPPAMRTGSFSRSWRPIAEGYGDTYISRIESSYTVNGYLLGELLEYGTRKMAPRPHHERIQQEALPRVQRIYEEPYF